MSSDLNIRSLTIGTRGICFMKKGVEALHKVGGNQHETIGVKPTA